MNKEEIIEKTIQIIQFLPPEKAEEISDFASFLAAKHEEYLISNSIQILTSENPDLKYLLEEEELYTLSDLKETYYAKR